MLTTAQHRRLEACIRDSRCPRDYVKKKLAFRGIEHINEVPAHRVDELVAKLPEWLEDFNELAAERAAIVWEGMSDEERNGTSR